MGIENVPNELVIYLFKFLRNKPQKFLLDLRLVSRLFNDVIMPLAFTQMDFSISGRFQSIALCDELTHDLSMWQTSAFRHLEKVTIWTYPFDTEEHADLQEAWNKLMRVLFEKHARHLTRVDWIIDPWSFPHTQAEIMRLLSSLKPLPEIIFRLYNNFIEVPVPLLSPISGLKKLGVTWDRRESVEDITITELVALVKRCPDLKSLSFCYIPDLEYYFKPLSLLDILPKKSDGCTLSLKKLEVLTHNMTRRDIQQTAHHLRSLEYFIYLPYLLHGETTSARAIPIVYEWEASDIWASFLEEKIWLKSIWTNATSHPSFIEYLRSCKNIRSLQLTLKGTDLICEFFEDILPLFSDTIEALEVRMGERTPHLPAALQGEDIASLTKCHALRVLRMDVPTKPADFEAGESKLLNALLEICVKLPSLENLEVQGILFVGPDHSKKNRVLAKRAFVNTVQRFFQSNEVVFSHNLFEDFRFEEYHIGFIFTGGPGLMLYQFG